MAVSVSAMFLEKALLLVTTMTGAGATTAAKTIITTSVTVQHQRHQQPRRFEAKLEHPAGEGFSTAREAQPNGSVSFKVIRDTSWSKGLLLSGGRIARKNCCKFDSLVGGLPHWRGNMVHTKKTTNGSLAIDQNGGHILSLDRHYHTDTKDR